MTDSATFDAAAAPTSTIRDDAAALGGKAADRLVAAADTHKGTVAEPMRQVSDAIEAAADQLADDGTATPPWVAAGLRSLANGVSQFAGKIESNDSRQMMTEVQDFARHRPMIFLAGCAAVGFAAARVLRAGASAGTTGNTDTYGDTDNGMASTAMSGATDAASNGGMTGMDRDAYTAPMGAGSM